MNPGALPKEESRLYGALKKRYGSISNPEIATKFGIPPEAFASRRTPCSAERVIAELKALAARDEPVRWKEVRPYSS
jgi:hypothetical protein